MTTNDSYLGGASAPGDLKRSLTDAACMMVVVLVFFFSFVLSNAGKSADLLALYAASLAFANGDLNVIYPVYEGLFTVMPPPEWYPLMAEQGYTEVLYPFIYPPLWAALGSRVFPLMAYESLVFYAGPVNLVLLLTTFYLAFRIARPRMRLLPYLAIASCLILLTTPGSVAVLENQPQILLGVLLLWAIERSLAGAPVAAGVILAFAAALKGFPALFVLVWIFSGNWRAVVAFAVAGAGLGGASVALAGWQLHLEFLHVIGAISDTAVLLTVIEGFNPLIAQFVQIGPENIITRLDLLSDDGVPSRYIIVEKTALWSAVGTFAPIAILSGIGVLMRKADRSTCAVILWPSALLWAAFFAPLPWAYTYIAPLAFVPALISRAPALGIVAASATMSMYWYFAGMFSLWGLFPVPTSFIGTVAMAVVGLMFALGYRTLPDPRLPSAGRPV